MKSKRTLLLIALVLPLLCLAAILAYNLPPIHERLAWRVDELRLRIAYQLNPPAQVIFVPGQETPLPPPQVSVVTAALADQLAFTPTVDLPPDQPVATPAASPTPTIPATPLPGKAQLSGVRYEDQHGRFNYCAPANLSMALSYWGWEGNRDIVGPQIKPDPKDKNVMPYEMADYVENQTDFNALVRMGGDLETIKRFIASGYPVLVEKGTYLTDLSGVKSWMGHYQVITGYDDATGEFTAQDSYVGPDRSVAYEDMEKNWRAFNYSYMIIYPPDHEAQVLALLGTDADVTANYQHAAQKASDEIYGLDGIDQYFAWYNRGTNLMLLSDYTGAGQAYDQAFALYPNIPEAQRPWRMLWYQTGPYFAYYHSGRYWDVFYLAENTLSAMQSDKNLEETYYWRGMANVALGNTSGAIEDFRLALKYHPGFQPAEYQLSLLGIQP